MGSDLTPRAASRSVRLPTWRPSRPRGGSQAIGPTTDVYGLGSILYELLTGSPPFRGEGQLDTLRQVITDAPLPPRRRRREVPAELEAIVLNCLEKDPARRFPSARALAEDLDRFLADLPTKARPAGFLTGAWRWVLRPQRIRDAGMIAMGYAFMAILWLIYGAMFVRLGIVFHLQRPAEFYRDALLVTFGDFVPALWLGWKIRDGRLWAVWAGLATAIVRLCLVTGGLFGMPPRFGGFYDNVMMRMAIYVALVNLALIVFVSNLVALLAYYSNKEAIRSDNESAGRQGRRPSRRPSAQALAADLNRAAVGEPTPARPPGRGVTLGRRVSRHPAALVVLVIATALAGALWGVGYWYKTRLSESRQVVRDLHEHDRLNALAAGRARYVANVRQAATYISKFQPRNAVDLLMRQLPEPGEDDLREFSWHHLLQRCHTERHTLVGHRGEVYFVAYSPRGDLLASAGKDGTVRLWNTTTSQQVRAIRASLREVNVAAFSPDGKTLATVDDDGKLKLWETATGHPGLERIAHKGDAVMAQFTADGKTIITAGRTDGFAKIWDSGTGEILGSFAAQGAILSMDGSILATLSEAEVKLWSVKSQTPIGSFAGGRGIAGGAFSHDGTKLATADEAERVVRLWDVASRRLIHEFQGHNEGAIAVIFSADDQTIVSAGDDNTIRFWDVATRKPGGVHLGHKGRVWNLALAPGGQTIASASRDGTVKLWDLEVPGDHLKLPIIEPVSFGFEQDSQTLLTLEVSNGWFIARWDAQSGSLMNRIPLDLSGGTHSFSAFSNDGRMLATADQDGTVILWDTTTGRLQGTVDPASTRVDFLEFSPDDHYLLMDDPIRKHALWDLARQRSIPFPWDELAGVAFAPSGELAVPLHDGQLVWWDPSSGRTKRISLSRPRYMDHLIVSVDCRFLAAAEPFAPQMHIWSIDTLERKKDLSGHSGGDTRPRAFSPDGKSLASSGNDRTVKIWDVATGEELLTLEGFSGPVQSCRFSPDGKMLATISNGAPGNHAEIFLWRTAAYELGTTALDHSVAQVR